ncbi:hypothetical protein, partial [Enterobacter hormaechei]
ARVAVLAARVAPRINPLASPHANNNRPEHRHFTHNIKHQNDQPPLFSIVLSQHLYLKKKYEPTTPKHQTRISLFL